jgi:hypothetical protein
MNKQDLHRLWQKGQQKITSTQKISKMEIEAYIKPRVKKSSIGIKFNLIFYTLLAFACLIILVLNSFIYITDPVILLINAFGIILSAYIIYYGGYSYQKIRQTEKGTENLSLELQKKIDFYNRIYGKWKWYIPILILILIFAVGSLVDNQDGSYRINKPIFYAIINGVIFFFIYLVNKITHDFWLKEIKSYLQDIGNQLMEGTIEIETRRKKYAWVIFLIIILLTAFFIWGIFLFI